jgi:DedD protein
MNDTMQPSQARPAAPGGAAQPGRQVNRTVRAVAIAVAVVLALLGALAAYETLNRDVPPPPSAGPAAPPPAPQTAAVEPAPVPAVAEAPRPEPAADAAQAAKDDSGLAGMSESRPPVAAERPMSDTVSGGAAEPRQRAAERPRTVASAVPGPRPDTRAAGVPGAWFVQAGVFNNLANAEAMRDKLTSNGFPALLEVRVLAGPYPDRDEAQQAQRRLGELGIAPTLLVPARKPAPD